jgi:hypothetical protein
MLRNLTDLRKTYSRISKKIYLVRPDKALGHREHGCDGENLVTAVVLTRGCKKGKMISFKQ